MAALLIELPVRLNNSNDTPGSRGSPARVDNGRPNPFDNALDGFEDLVFPHSADPPAEVFESHGLGVIAPVVLGKLARPESG